MTHDTAVRGEDMGRKVMIGCGGVLLMSVLLLAAFSLGVYAGRGDLLSGQAPAIVGPGPGAQPAPPRQQPPPAPQPALVGRVQSVDPGGMLLVTPQGLRGVSITPATQFQRQVEEGQPPVAASFADIRRGVVVSVFGRPGDDGRGLVADMVVILP